MSNRIRLSVLDQSPVRGGNSAAQAIAETVELARLADRLGYTRFWVAEHHANPMLAGSAPEILCAHIASCTSHIRVGTGGIMLPHYSSFKVAEVFRMLEALHPGRIDMGLGRAPGSDPQVSAWLRSGREVEFDTQVSELVTFMCSTPGILPPDTLPEAWLLTSGGSSALLAGRLGLSLCAAHFLHPASAEAALQAYFNHFVPGDWQLEPAGCLAVFAPVCRYRRTRGPACSKPRACTHALAYKQNARARHL